MSVKVVIAACFYYSGLVGLRRWWIQHLGPHLIILNYHTAAGGDLRKHLLYLRRHYRLLHLEEALEELYSPSVPSRRDRRTPLAITFDDGYYDNYTHCLALARELRIPLTIFLIPGYIETGERFWWLEPDYLVTHASVSEVTIEGQTYQLTTSKERAALAKAIDSRIRFASSVGERETYLHEVRQLLAVPNAVTLEERGKLPVSWAEVAALKKSEWISFGSHTMHHPLLAYLTDPGESDEEVRESRTVLVQHLKSAVRSFAYPVGKFGDIGEQGVRSVQRAGYAWAVTTINGVNTPERDPYLLHRFGVDVGEHWLVIAAKATGVWNFFTSLARMKFLQKLRTGYFSMSRTDKTKENTNWLSRLGRRKLVSFLVLLLILFALPVATFLVKQRLEPRLYEVRTGKVYSASPGDNLQNKIDRMQPGDTLLLENGAYYSPLYISNKQGTAAAPLTIKAVNDGKAIIDGSHITTEWTPPVFIGDGSAYIDLEGVVARNAPQSSTDANVNEDVIKIFGTGTHDITLRRVTAHDAAPGNYHCFDVGFGARHVLIEDSAGWGRCRYVFVTYHGDHNTFRRDFAYGPYQAQADFYPAPRSGFGNYGSTNSLFENDISINAIPSSYDNDYYSGLWQDSDGSAYPDDNAQFLGDIFYNNCDGFVVAGTSFGKNEVMKDTFLSAPDNAACDTYTNRYAGGSAKGMEWDSPDNGLIAYTTFVQSPGGFSGSGASAVVNITNSVFLSQGTAIVNGDPRLSHDDFYSNGSNGIRLNSTDKTANPGYNTAIYGMGAYLMPAPALLGQGQNGADIGSHIIYEYVNGQLTNTPLWPWPMENRIMAEKGISVTWAANGGIWNTLNGVYPKATGTSSPKNV